MRGLKLADVAFLARAATTPVVAPPVAGFVLWLAPESNIYADAAGTTPAVIAEEVRHWQDLSGNNNHAVWTTALNMGVKGPQWTATTLNSRRLLRFGHAIPTSPSPLQDGRSGLLTTSNVTLTTGVTVFFVGCLLNPGAAEAFGGFFGYNNFEMLIRRDNVTERISTYHNSSGVTITDPVTIGLSSYQRFVWRLDPGADGQRLFRAGASVVQAADAGAMPAAGPVAVGFRQDDGISSHGCCDIAEMIVYPTALSNGDVSTVNSYLASKYGVA